MSKKKHKTFDEDEVVEVEEAVVPTGARAAEIDEDASPEEVVQNEIQIKVLKEEIENLFSVQKESKRKRKFTAQSTVAEESEDEDEYLDENLLAEVGAKVKSAKKTRGGDQDGDEDSDEDDQASQQSGRIDTKKRKM